MADIHVTSLPASGGTRQATGGGSWTLTDPNGRISLGSSKLKTVGGDSAFIGLKGDALALTPGRAAIAHLKGVTYNYFGFGSGASPSWGFRPQHGGVSSALILGPSGTVSNGSYTPDTVNGDRYAVVRGENGRHFFALGNKLAWVSSEKDTVALSLMLQYFHPNCNEECDYAQLVDLPAPWTTEYGLATSRIAGTIASGATATMEANAFLEFTITAMPTTNHGHVEFRRMDSQNYWRLSIILNGAAIQLFEIVNGVSQLRGDWATTPAAGDRIVVTCDGTTISAYRNNTKIGSYTGATSHQTATGVRFPMGGGLALSDAVCWKRDVDLDSAIAAGTGLLDDQFTTLNARRLSEPGPGMLAAITDTKGRLSIAGGKMKCTEGMVNLSFQDPLAVWGDQNGLPFARAAGRAFLFEIEVDASVDGDIIGWRPTASGAVNVSPAAFRLSGSGLIHFYSSAGSVIVGSYQTGIRYQCAVVLRGTGAFLFVKGGLFTEWTLLWVRNVGTEGPLYPFWALGIARTSLLDNVRVVDLPAPFSSDYGLATTYQPNPVGDTFYAHEPDTLIELTWTAGATSTELHFRRADSQNYWYLALNPAISTIALYEVVGGVATNRGSATQTFANGTSYRIVVGADQNVISVYVDVTRVLHYTGAVTGLSATQMRFPVWGSGVHTNLIAWPRTRNLGV